ncbi:hypothetical protein [Rossellomorea marisflavi]|uniref:hypothetical protein n=1 Tax=Rossellomorea marisflavi TaxID=189381 RepID=UPI00345972D7
MKKMIQLGALILGVTIANIVIFSPGFIGLALTGGALEAALGASILTASTIGVLYGVYALRFKEEEPLQILSLASDEDYKEALSRFFAKKSLREDLHYAIEQVDRLEQKKASLQQAINDRFQQGEMSHRKFSHTVLEVEQLFFQNVRNLLNKAGAFDEREYKSVRSKDPRLSQTLLAEKTSLYREYLFFIKQAIEINEEIILDLDKLLLEITRLNTVTIEDIDNMACMKEIHSLINQTKLYKT